MSVGRSMQEACPTRGTLARPIALCHVPVPILARIVCLARTWAGLVLVEAHVQREAAWRVLLPSVMSLCHGEREVQHAGGMSSAGQFGAS